MVENPNCLANPPFIYDEGTDPEHPEPDIDENVPGLPGQNASDPYPITKRFAVHWIMRRGATYYDPSYGITAIGTKDYTSKAIALVQHPTDPTRWRRPLFEDANNKPVYMRFVRQW